MNYFLDEKEAIAAINSIRVSPFTEIDNKRENGMLTSTFRINTFRQIWDFATFSISEDDISEKSEREFEFSLENPFNSDRLIIANSETQKQNKSNILTYLLFIWNNIWIPIIKGQLNLTESQIQNLFPDIFILIPDNYISVNEKTQLLFTAATEDLDLADLLYSEFFQGSQPIYIKENEFLDFCKENNIV